MMDLKQLLTMAMVLAAPGYAMDNNDNLGSDNNHGITSGVTEYENSRNEAMGQWKEDMEKKIRDRLDTDNHRLDYKGSQDLYLLYYMTLSDNYECVWDCGTQLFNDVNGYVSSLDDCLKSITGCDSLKPHIERRYIPPVNQIRTSMQYMLFYETDTFKQWIQDALKKQRTENGEGSDIDRDYLTLNGKYTIAGGAIPLMAGVSRYYKSSYVTFLRGMLEDLTQRADAEFKRIRTQANNPL